MKTHQSPLFLLLCIAAASCMSEVRDYSQCNEVSPCMQGFVCEAFRCVPSQSTDALSDAVPGNDALEDALAPDGGDALSGCTSNVQCGDPANPLCINQACVACSVGSAGACAEATPAKPMCAPSGACVACLSHGDCSGDTPICEGGACVACGDAAAGKCGERDAALSVCQSNTGRCVGCVANADCANATSPICRNNTCAGCVSDPECVAAKGAEPGVCLAHLDGRCAAAADVVYAKNDPGTCSDNAAEAGGVGKPFCSVQDAIGDAVGKNKAAVVMRGGQVKMTFAQPGKTLLVVGQEGAAFAPGFGGSAISATGGNLWVRSVNARGSESVGVVATGTNTQLHLQNMVITGNAGGVLIDGAGFSIENTIVAENKVGQSGAVSFGGIFINNPPGAGPKRLRHVTVVGNMQVGISCSAQIEGVGVVVSGNSEPQIGGPCMITACCSGALSLSPAWRLTNASTACIDKVPPATSLPFDIDHTLRPQGVQSDCGAHEFVP